MSKISDYYSQLAASIGMRYDSENDVIYGQKEGFDLILYAADSRYPYTMTLHTAAKTPTGAAIHKDEFKVLAKNVKNLGVGSQEGNNITIPLTGSVNQKKLRDSLASVATEGINGLISFLREKGCSPCCSLCGQPEEIAAYKSGGSYYHLCQKCETNMRGNMAMEAQKQAQKKENIAGGIVGAIIGSLLGVVCIVLLSQLGYVAALSGVVMAIGVLKGYELLGGRLTKKGIVISIVIMLIMTYLGDRLDWAIRVLRDGGGADVGNNLFECYRMIPMLLKLELIEMTAYIGNLVLLYVFLLLGAVPTIMSKIKEKKEEGQMVRIGSAGGYGSHMN
ncbi:MAG: hypothetical protein K2K63_05115 [Acetatifactor sp.]|nr:hypothetical protein [Acetatifactor sp.]